MTDFGLLIKLRKHHETTYYHSIRVAVLSYQVARMLNMPLETRDHLYQAGLLHDIGKLLVPSQVLSLSRKLTNSEYEIVKLHVTYGVELLRKYNVKKEVIEGIRGHHEREDGSGYPKGDQKHNELSKIIAVCDVYDAMTENREYREGLSPTSVLSLMEAGELGAFKKKYIKVLKEVVESSIDINRDILSIIG